MRRPMLKEWMPKPGRTLRWWTSEHYEAELRRSFEAFGIPGRTLEAAEAARAWTKVAEKVRAKTGVDLVESEAYFMWELLEPQLETIPSSLALDTPTAAFVVLEEGRPDWAFLAEVDSLCPDDLPPWGADYVVAPWPRVGWIALRPHEEAYGPYRLGFK